MTTRIDLPEIQTRVKNKILSVDMAARLLSLPLFEIPSITLENKGWFEYFKDQEEYPSTSIPAGTIMPFQEFVAVLHNHYYWIKLEGSRLSEVMVTAFGFKDADNQVCYIYSGYMAVFTPEPVLEWRLAYTSRCKIVRNPKEVTFQPVGKLSNYPSPSAKTILNTAGSDKVKQAVVDSNVAKFAKEAVRPALAIIIAFFKYQQEMRQTAVTVTPTEKPVTKGTKKPVKTHTYGATLGPRVIYLDRLPSVKEAEEESCIERKAQRRHQRAAHGRTLKHPRYKNHPMYMVPNGLVIESYWVGPEEEEYMGNIYRIHKTA